jgi:hypothetical protein
MMTRKDYVETASILADFIGDMPISNEQRMLDLVHDFADMFEADNPRFLRDRFISACYDFEEAK